MRAACRGKGRGGAARRAAVRSAAVMLVLLVGGLFASAASAAPVWQPDAGHYPTNFPPGGTGHLTLNLRNVGDAASTDPTTVEVQLASGLTATSFTGLNWSCSAFPATTVTCTWANPIAAGAFALNILVSQPLDISVSVAPDATGPLVSSYAVSSAGTATASTTDTAPVSATPAGFGVQAFDGAVTSDAAGDAETRAGAHPYAASTTIRLNTDENGVAFGLMKTISTELPLGFVGNPTITPKCSTTQLASNTCPVASQVGIVDLYITRNRLLFEQPVFNVVPAPGVPAQFGFRASSGIVNVLTKLRPDGYGLDVDVVNVDESISLTRADLTFWGVPADPAHDTQRGFLSGLASCAQLAVTGGGVPCSHSSGIPAEPFLTNPTACPADGSGLATNIAIDAWSNPGVFTHATFLSHLPPGLPDPGPQQGPTDCGSLSFQPSMTAGADAREPDAPTGLDVGIDFPQDAMNSPVARAGAHLKRAVVTLPDGMSINPSAADGLVGCTDDQLGLGTDTPTACPDAAKIGTVAATTPLLDDRLTGDVYIRTQASDDPQSGEMFRIALVFREPDRGVLVKLAGQVRPDPVTGQIVATFDDNPQLPITNLDVRFKPGPRAPLATPRACGDFSTQAVLTPWSAPFTADALLHSATTTIDRNCDQVGKFEPTLEAGTDNPVSGAHSPLSVAIARPGAQQELKAIDSVVLPAGLLGMVGSVPLCADAAMAAGTCDEGSRIGHVQVAAGAGSQPLWVPQPGKAPTAVYLGGPYKGAPFSLSIVVPAQAGPFDLGTVVVRAALFVDRHDAHVTVVADPIPQILDGVPLRTQRITVNVDRPGFMVNPTSCDPKVIAADLQSVAGATAHVSSRFQVGDCRTMPFTPQVAAQTRGKLAFKHGASLNVHIAMPGGDANIKTVQTTLPKSLPSRLIPTINNACLIDVFHEDYRQCPDDSYVGTVSAVTPLLDQPLTGPVYIVSPPGDVPRLEIVLLGQGAAAGVRVDLEGDVIVDIGDGRSQVTFDTVPDVPVTSFDLTLPTGPHSILDAPSNDLCSGPLQMYMSLTGQNGRRDDGYKTVKVTDCPHISKVKVVSGKATSTGVRLRVLAPAEGRLTVSGSGLRPVARTVNRKLTYTVSVPLSPAGKRAIARRGRLKVQPRVTFKPVNAPKASTVRAKAITVKKHAARHKAKARSSSFWASF